MKKRVDPNDKQQATKQKTKRLILLEVEQQQNTVLST